jgi:hypothetical protein
MSDVQSLAQRPNCAVLVSMKLPLFFAVLAPVLVQAADDDGFVPLFDGKSLAGWINVNCAPETWTVRDGMIHCDGVPTGALRSEKQYENFILELEWRHLKPAGNSGVFIWAGPMPALGQPFLRAIEVQVLENAFGDTDSHTTHAMFFRFTDQPSSRFLRAAASAVSRRNTEASRRRNGITIASPVRTARCGSQ